MCTNNSDGGKSVEQQIDHTDAETLRRLYWDEELSLSEIGDLSGVNQSTVHYWMEKHDIDRLSDSEGSFRTQSTNYASTRVNNNGHVVWRCNSDRGGGTVPVHRLMAIAEHGTEAVEDKDVHHINGIPWDNRPENLELMNHGDHMSHHNIGPNNPDAKLTPEQVVSIKNRLSGGDTPYHIAKDYPVTPTLIRHIKNGEAWDSVSAE